MARLAGVIAVIVILGIFYDKHRSHGQVTAEIADATAMEIAIAKLVPDGMPIADAQRAMECEGFTCEVTLHHPCDDPAGTRRSRVGVE